MGTEMQTKMLPALATQLKMSPEQLQAFLGSNFPATAKALQTMPAGWPRCSAQCQSSRAAASGRNVWSPQTSSTMSVQAAKALPTRVRTRSQARPGPHPCGQLGQKAPAPLGVPRPDGPSQPTRAVHHCVVGQVPLDPAVTSNRDPVWLYGMAFAYPAVLPDSA